MNRIAKESPEFRRLMFEEAGARKGIDPSLIEKDFWVCWTLKRIFEIDVLREHLIFKGGTSLSKVHNAIKRFSEDIDLTIGKELLGFTDKNDPNIISARKEREKTIDKMMAACSVYVNGDLANLISKSFAQVLADGWRLEPDASDADRQTLLFYYPLTLKVPDYISPAVKLEFGSKSDMWPSSISKITPYAAEFFPKSFDEPFCELKVLSASRTFWEKATILHQEAHRSNEKALPSRQSRHYYDLAMLSGTGVRKEALNDLSLLKRVVEHKQYFFRCGWAQYDKASPGTFRLMPGENRFAELRKDYDNMRIMMFEQPPSLDEIISCLEQLEKDINKL
ncbi:MAG TPA: hypothetical protein DCZ94_05430 [Lentisphaeria bacterium]|nr:MAG: hypothetical protein A2X48_00880 [Lentisphaerae bacterium GWF2_49_21]HBC86379.1 hypothetical protein [Lentisphaeria bacterium]